METNNQFTWEPDCSRDGYLVYKNAKTLERYFELKNLCNSFDMKSVGIFFAFSNEQFRKGYEETKHLRGNGEKLYRYAGGYGSKKAWDAYFAYLDKNNERISKECDPQEVYVYEYNNHECCISWDGDIEPMKIVISLFGEERASEVQRQCNRECLSVERIVELMKNDLA